MRPSGTVETKLLSKTVAVIDGLLDAKRAENGELRLQLLEATASRLGGFDLEEYEARFGIEALRPSAQLLDDARAIVQSMDDCGIQSALALARLQERPWKPPSVGATARITRISVWRFTWPVAWSNTSSQTCGWSMPHAALVSCSQLFL